ncbi:MAG: ROK family protein [Sphaerochaetaceae bacterium]
MTPYLLGYDLGATRLKCAVLDTDYHVLETFFCTPEDGKNTREMGREDWKVLMRSCLDKTITKYKAEPLAFGISSPGIPLLDHSAIRNMPGRLTEIQGLNWSDLLEYPHPIYVVNDGKAAFIAELQDPWLQTVQNVLMLTLGTGVGGAIKADGVLLEGKGGRAGHLGSMSLDVDGPLALTGVPGGLDNLVGNVQLEERTNGLYKDYIALERDYVANKTVAVEYWLKMVKHLAIGIVSLINILDPEVIIIGGGLANAGENLLAPLRDYLDIYEWRPYGEGVKIIRAKGGDFSGAIGTAIFGDLWSKKVATGDSSGALRL